MTSAVPAVEQADSLEVRWIIRGPLMTATREWFARFPATVETRTDAYLLQPRLAGLSVKLRDRARLDVKSYLGSPGEIDLPRRCHGRLESWRKWSFGYGPADPGDVLPAGWIIVRKRRHRCRFPLGAGGCVAELTQACVRGEAWWSLGLEATGSAGLLRDALDHAAGLVFAQPLPAGIELSLDRSRSYLDWLTEAGRDDGSAAGGPGGALRSLNAMPSRTSRSAMPPRM
jgi:hypothetical protein